MAQKWRTKYWCPAFPKGQAETRVIETEKTHDDPDVAAVEVVEVLAETHKCKPREIKLVTCAFAGETRRVGDPSATAAANRENETQETREKRLAQRTAEKREELSRDIEVEIDEEAAKRAEEEIDKEDADAAAAEAAAIAKEEEEAKAAALAAENADAPETPAE